jgi:ribosomal protein S18 acetylase RimI-like enzyme
MPHPLDSVVWSSLTGPHAHLAQGTLGARRYLPDVSPFAALDPGVADHPGRYEQPDRYERPDRYEHPDRDERWAALRALIGPGGTATLTGPPVLIAGMPADWKIGLRLPGVQMIATEALAGRPDPEAVVLGDDDVPEMLALVRRTKPGPFEARTRTTGQYLGIRRNGVLIAMAGERMHPPGHTEISAVCTDQAFRGQGLAGRLIRAVAHGVRERGEIPFLHAAQSNAAAIGLYESLGFVVRWRPEFFFLHTAA